MTEKKHERSWPPDSQVCELAEGGPHLTKPSELPLSDRHIWQGSHRGIAIRRSLRLATMFVPRPELRISGVFGARQTERDKREAAIPRVSPACRARESSARFPPSNWPRGESLAPNEGHAIGIVGMTRLSQGKCDYPGIVHKSLPKCMGERPATGRWGNGSILPRRWKSAAHGGCGWARFRMGEAARLEIGVGPRHSYPTSDPGRAPRETSAY
jgi:hypothetical protein